MTPQKVQKIIDNILIPQNILFIFLTPPPKKKNEIQNFEPPKVDRTYLYMIILEYHPPPPTPLRRKLTTALREVCTKI